MQKGRQETRRKIANRQLEVGEMFVTVPMKDTLTKKERTVGKTIHGTFLWGWELS